MKQHGKTPMPRPIVDNRGAVIGFIAVMVMIIIAIAAMTYWPG